jgi:hypothetical protein
VEFIDQCLHGVVEEEKEGEKKEGVKREGEKEEEEE